MHEPEQSHVTNWLLIHGLSREQRHWGAFPEALRAATGGEVRSLDAPGLGTECGRVSPRSVREITDDLRSRFNFGDEAWSVLGMSLGGMITMDWCARYPGDFEQAVVVNTSANDSAFHQRFRPGVFPSLGSVLFRSIEAKERMIMALSSNRAIADNDALARQWASWAVDAPGNPRSIARQVGAVVRFVPPPAMPVPLLVLASRGDRLVSHRCSERLANRYGAEIRGHDSAGHDLPLDDPAWVCRQVTTWAPHRQPATTQPTRSSLASSRSTSTSVRSSAASDVTKSLRL